MLSINGFGAPQFNSAAGAMVALHQRISALYRVGGFKEWKPDQEDAYPILDFSNRFLTLRELAGDCETVPFSHYVDPAGILQGLVGREVVHLDDNEVAYFEQHVADE